jgi:predicted nucleotide-binding protein (sugar kinase/HSP70/actin superfamily)
MKNYEINQRLSDAIHTKLTRTVVNILNQYFKNINEYIAQLYKLNLHFFVKAPMVKN